MDSFATKGRSKTLLAVMLVSCFLCGPAVTLASAAGAVPLAKVSRIQGGATIQRADASGFVPLAEGVVVTLQDVVATDADETSKIMLNGLLPSDTEAFVGTHTAFGFAGYDKTASASTCFGHLGHGIARFIKVLPDTFPRSSFVVFTSTAVIEVLPCDDRADFVVEALDQKRSSVTCIRGKIRVRNVSEKLLRAMLLTGCRQAVIEKDMEPFSTRVSTEVLTRLISRTTIPGTVSEKAFICEEDSGAPPEPLLDVDKDPKLILPPPAGLSLPPGTIKKGTGAAKHMPEQIRAFVPTKVPIHMPTYDGDFTNPRTEQEITEPPQQEVEKHYMPPSERGPSHSLPESASEPSGINVEAGEEILR
jgi:hypothetical protein